MGGPTAKLKKTSSSVGADEPAETVSSDHSDDIRRQQSTSGDTTASEKSNKRRKQSSSSVWLTWIFTVATALSLFQTFTYEPEFDDVHPLEHMIDHSEWKVDHEAWLQEQEHKKKEAAKSSVSAALGWKVDPNAEIVQFREIPIEHPMQKNAIFRVLRDAGVTFLERKDFEMLPDLMENWNKLYETVSPPEKNRTLVYGMEQCAAYRAMVPKERRYAGPAGMFNTGTNNLDWSMARNLAARSLYQVPWGKHRMENVRLVHVAYDGKKLNQTECLPVVIIRDPYAWMQSMCKTAYAARWKHSGNRCPNLVPTGQDMQRWKEIVASPADMHSTHETMTFQVKVIFDQDNKVFFDSLVDLWNDWYRPYFRNEKNYPRLMIRFEDMLLRTPEVIGQIADCMGVSVNPNFKFNTGSAKPHGSHTNFLSAILKTADAQRRMNGLTLKDKIYAAQTLDQELMQTFGYSIVED